MTYFLEKAYGCSAAIEPAPATTNHRLAELLFTPMSSKRTLVVATIGWLLCALAYSYLTFRHYAGQRDQMESAIGAFIQVLAPFMLALVLLGMWRIVRMRFPR